MPKLFEIRIPFTEDNNILVYNSLYLNDISTILEDKKELVFYLEDEKLDILNNIINYLKENKFPLINEIKQYEFKNKDWNEKWKKSIKPVIIKDKIIIYPSWRFNEVQKYNGKIFIQIDPKMSFGTGHNETTQLMIEMLCLHSEPGDKYMLDYGCGTGVLAITSIKLGYHKAIAIDIDNDSIENAEENIRVNNVDFKIDLHLSDIENIKENNFDVICINILRSVIEEKLETIKDKLKSEGKLFISGILFEESEKFLKYLKEKKISIVETTTKKEWIGIYAKK